MGERRNSNSVGEVGGGQYSATSKKMYSQNAYLARDKQFSKRLWVLRLGLRLLQNKNPHINLSLQGYKDALSRSGNATLKKKAPFFDEIHKILSDKPATRPVIILSSTSLESVQSKETELTNSERSPQPSCSYPTLEKEKRKKAEEKHLCCKFVVVSMLMRKMLRSLPPDHCYAINVT